MQKVEKPMYSSNEGGGTAPKIKGVLYMIKSIKVRVKGETVEIPIPEGASALDVVMDGGVSVSIEAPMKGYTAGKVFTRVEMNRLLMHEQAPDVTLCACEWDKEQETTVWRTDAMMYVSYNGRIIGKNMTYGFGGTEKPLATRPWRSSNYKKPEHTEKPKLTSENGIEIPDQSQLDIGLSDSVTIEAQGITVTGKVLTAHHYGRDGWYIELDDANVPGGYSYWKQGVEGGKITKINGSEV